MAGSSTDSGMDPAAAFMALVDSFVRKNPVRTDAVRKADIRWAAAKILLYQTVSADRLKLFWTGPDAPRLAGVLFILFAEVGLGKKRSTTLGMTSIQLYEMLETVVRKSGLTRDGLCSAVMETSTGASTTALALVQSHEIDVLFETPSDTPPEAASSNPEPAAPASPRSPRKHGSYPRSPRTPMSQHYSDESGDGCLHTIDEEPDLSVPESACLPSQPSAPPDEAPTAGRNPDSSVRQQLATRYQRVRKYVLVVRLPPIELETPCPGQLSCLTSPTLSLLVVRQSCVAWVGLAELLSRQLPNQLGRVLMFLLYFLLVVSILCSTFPTELTSHAALKLLRPLAYTVAVGAAANAVTGYYSYSSLQVGPAGNAGADAVHALFVVSMITIWMVAAFLGHRGRFSWGAFRIVLALDGVLFFASALALRFVGEPSERPVYPPCGPGCVPFHAALVRAATTLIFSTTATAERRLMIASLANKIGLNHVTLSLQDVTPPGARHDDDGSSSTSDKDSSWLRVTWSSVSGKSGSSSSSTPLPPPQEGSSATQTHE